MSNQKTKKNGSKTLAEYADRAIDLTRRNRLLRSSQNTKSIIFNKDFKDFIAQFKTSDDFCINFPHQQVLNYEKNPKKKKADKKLSSRPVESSETFVKQKALLQTDKSSYLPQTNMQGEKLINALSSFRLEAKRNYEEHGLHTLFLTIGRVKWKEPSIGDRHSGNTTAEYDYNAPLLLIPIRIEETKNPKTTVVSMNLEADDIKCNEVLSLLLKQEYNASLLEFNQGDCLDGSQKCIEKLLESYRKLHLQVNTIFSELKLEFEIADDVQIGQYSFFGQQIYQDLKQNEDAIIEHDFINALCTHSPLNQKNLAVKVENPDLLLSVENDFNVVDADRSQLRVLHQVINGNSLNIQGPPGTGKSQTIVNLIANLLAREKTILMVCEKQVALQVVLDRLKKVGLHNLCLPLFRYSADKKMFAKSIVEDRDSIINRMQQTRSDKDLNAVFVNRTKRIDYLRDYARVLGELVEPLFKSVHWVHGEFVKYKDQHSDGAINWKGQDPLEMDTDKYNSIMSLLSNMTSIYNIASEKESCYWESINKPFFPPDFASRVNQALQDLNVFILTSADMVNAFDCNGVKPVATLSELLQQYEFLDMYDKQKQILNKWHISFEQIKAEQILHIVNRFNSTYASFLRYLYPRYYIDCKAISDLCLINKPSKHREYSQILEGITLYLESKKVEESLPFMVKQLLPKLQKWHENYEKTITDIDQLFGNDQFTSHCALLPFDDFLKTIEHMIDNSNHLKNWIDYQRCARKLESLGQAWFLTETKNKIIVNPAALFAHSLWSAWLDAYYAKNPSLQNFSPQEHNCKIEEFKEFESRSLQFNALRILKLYAPEFECTRRLGGEEEKLLIHQSQLKMRHKPIRQFVQGIGKHLLKYKPCWMMSPLSLSSYIPLGSLEFDVVIFDEASQVRVEHALGAIARAKQVLILGDENQLPPTDFFNISNDGDDEEGQYSNDYESILHATKEILPGANHMLSYHYRSKYEDLIAFSNHYIYDDRLITFPNADMAHKAVMFEFVENGSFDGGKNGSRKNDIEAQRVVEICIKKVTEEPNKSLGVISFSKSQEVAIRDALQIHLKNNPQLQHLLDETGNSQAPFFIKNLESVQGDERDSIILSVGYGRDKNTGEIYNRFGPINGPHGHRRLNVAVTRAKEQIICVSSIRASDIRNTEKSRGAYLLQKYLEYAERGMVSLQASLLIQNQNDIAADSPFEEEVEAALQARGYTVHRQVGASGFKIDLAIVNQNNDQEYILGIECDGASYHSDYSARMNDRIRQDMLERLGWTLYRIWSQHWISDREAIVDDIVRKLTQLTE